MIIKEEIEVLLEDIENERVERTISTTNTDKFAMAVCAFANDLPNKNLPGYLFIGALDDGTLSGLKVTDELLRNLAGLRSDGNIQPTPALMVEKVSFPDGDLAVIEVQPSKNTPVKYKGVTYVRIGARKSIANEEEERILREKSEVKSPTFDTTPCLHSTIDDLDLELFKTDYLNPVIAVAMKTLGYVNQFGRGIETVQEELVANKNGLAVFKFDDIATFKVVVMSAYETTENDMGVNVGEMSEKNVGDTSEAVNDTDNRIDDTEVNVGEVSEKCRRRNNKKTEFNFKLY